VPQRVESVLREDENTLTEAQQIDDLESFTTLPVLLKTDYTAFLSGLYPEEPKPQKDTFEFVSPPQEWSDESLTDLARRINAHLPGYLQRLESERAAFVRSYFSDNTFRDSQGEPGDILVRPVPIDFLPDEWFDSDSEDGLSDYESVASEGKDREEAEEEKSPRELIYPEEKSPKAIQPGLSTEPCKNNDCDKCPGGTGEQPKPPKSEVRCSEGEVQQPLLCDTDSSRTIYWD